jgi:hypothetical protein
MVDPIKAELILTMILLARTQLDLAARLNDPLPWQVKIRHLLQDQAARILAETKEMR